MGLKVTPISGGVGQGGGPLAFLVELDGARILLDCGANDRPYEELGGDDDRQHAASWADSQRLYAQELVRLGPLLDLVLLSHPVLSCLGALPYLKTRAKLRCPIYATLPVKELGRRAVEEWAHQRALEEDVTPSHGPGGGADDDDAVLATGQRPNKRRRMSPDSPSGGEAGPLAIDLVPPESEVQSAFDSVVGVRYSQPVHLGGRLQGTIVVAYRAAHTLGGTIWALRSPLYSVATSAAPTLLYAPIFNHVKERHLDGAALLVSGAGSLRVGEGMARPNMLLLGAERGASKALKRRDRDRVLLDAVTATLRASRTVLIPSDASARTLELLCLLEQHWTAEHLGAFPLCLVSNTGKDVLAFVQSLTEWVGGDAAAGERSKPSARPNDFGTGPVGGLQFRHTKVFESAAALDRAIPTDVPKVIVAVPSTLSHGFARRLFSRIATIPGNLVLLTSAGDVGTLGHWLASQVDSRAAEDGDYTSGQLPVVTHIRQTVRLHMREKVPLSGQELAEHLEAARKAEKLRKQLSQARAAADGAADESDSDESDDDTGDPTVEIAAPAEGSLLALDAAVSRRGNPTEFVDEQDFSSASFDVLVRGQDNFHRASQRTLAQRFRVFPFVERRRRVDAYGEVIDVEGWLKRGEEAQGAVREMDVVPDKAAKPAENEETPVKYVTEALDIDIVCGFLLVDLEAKADGQALRTIVPQINPKSMVFVNGSAVSAQSLKSSLENVPQLSRQLAVPRVGEAFEIGEDLRSFPLRLGEGLLASLRLSKVGGFEVVQIVASLQGPEGSAVPTLEKATGAPNNDPVRPLQSTTTADGTAEGRLQRLTSASLFIGDLRLGALKARLGPVGVQATLAGGGLLVCKAAAAGDRAPVVTVRKAGKGELVVEGSAGPLYTAVKRVVYAMHASTA